LPELDNVIFAFAEEHVERLTGLTPAQLETALRSFAETQDPKDKGIAAYLEGQYSQAEDLLSKAVEKKESDLVESYRLGVNAYVVKPVEFGRFVEAVRELGVFWAVLNEAPPGSVRKGP